ncbi:MAG: ribose-phosphate diphosphokinase [Candidatus Pacebacteria bacterium]|nr:ribose-phosphate diphosphokinase [Candidatus Paceibacterota bacterium]
MYNNFMHILSGSSNPQLAKNIAQKLDVPLVSREISQFSNGEKRIWITDQLRGKNVALVQSFVNPVDETVVETLLMIDALERLGVRHVSLIIPWMGYSLQDKVFRPGEPISAKVIAKIISNAYVKRVLLMDLHNDSIPAFFDIPTNYLSALELFADYLEKNYDLKKAVIVSPDFGGLKRARSYAKRLGLDLINIDKTRDLKTGKVKAQELHGTVDGKTAVVLDDVIVSGGTTVEAANILKENGAKEVLFIASHGLLTNQAVDKITQSQTDKVVITNSIEHSQLSNKFEVLDVSSVFADNLKKWLR